MSEPSTAATAVAIRDCHYPWTWMMVTADGAVKPCCFAPGVLGHIGEHTADEVWNGPVAIELRSHIRDNKVHPVCAGAPCKFVQATELRKG
jgi:MoaA/NifB/PqqE/SkfB family radical SAM enzyme